VGDSVATITGLIVNPDGTVSYDFQGHVKATGLDLDAARGVPDVQHGVNWLSQADGALVAQAAAYTNVGAVSGNQQATLLAQARSVNRDANVKLQAIDTVNSLGEGASLYVTARAPASPRNKVVVFVNDDTEVQLPMLTILDSLGQSSFPLLDALRKVKLTLAADTVLKDGAGASEFPKLDATRNVTLTLAQSKTLLDSLNQSHYRQHDVLRAGFRYVGRWTAASWPPTPPGGLLDGDEADMIVAGYGVWRFQWNAAEATIYKWYFIGGVPFIYSGPVGNMTMTTPSWVTLTGGPSLTIPRSGIYYHRAVLYIGQTGGGVASSSAGVSVNGAVPLEYLRHGTDVAGEFVHAAGPSHYTGMTTGDVLTIQCICSTGIGTQFANATIELTPISVA
jgi:hypothetical protein